MAPERMRGARRRRARSRRLRARRGRLRAPLRAAPARRPQRAAARTARRTSRRTGRTPRRRSIAVIERGLDPGSGAPPAARRAAGRRARGRARRGDTRQPPPSATPAPTAPRPSPSRPGRREPAAAAADARRERAAARRSPGPPEARHRRSACSASRSRPSPAIGARERRRRRRRRSGRTPSADQAAPSQRAAPSSPRRRRRSPPSGRPPATRARRRTPASPDGRSLNDLGFALIQQGRYEEAIPILQRGGRGLPEGSSEHQLRLCALQPRERAAPRGSSRGGDPGSRAAARDPEPDRHGRARARRRAGRRRGGRRGGLRRSRERERQRVRAREAREGLAAAGPGRSRRSGCRSYPLTMATVTRSVHDVCVAAKEASHVLARVDRAAKDACLLDLADRIVARAPELLEANAADVEAGREEGLTEALIDRLTLTEARIAEMAKGVREIADARRPGRRGHRGLDAGERARGRKKRAPLGVVAIVYEARPNVTIDAAALCLKSGNAAVLRGSSSAETSNAVLAGLIAEALARPGAARGGGLAARRRRPRAARRAGDPGGPGRPDHSARRRGAEEGFEGGREGAGDVRGGGQLPRLRPRGRRSRDGAADRLQREGAAARGLQRGRDAARPRGRGAGAAAGAAAAAGRRRRRAGRRRARPRERRARSRSARRRPRTGTPSTTA